MAISTEQMRIYMREYRAKKRVAAKELLGGQCAHCGTTADLDFDHIDRSTKKDGIANILTNSKDFLAAEVAKCQLLCKPCHYKKSIACGDLKKSNHGDRQMYKKGCRCSICVKSQSEYRRSYYLRKGK